MRSLSWLMGRLTEPLRCCESLNMRARDLRLWSRRTEGRRMRAMRAWLRLRGRLSYSLTMIWCASGARLGHMSLLTRGLQPAAGVRPNCIYIKRVTEHGRMFDAPRPGEVLRRVGRGWPIKDGLTMPPGWGQTVPARAPFFLPREDLTIEHFRGGGRMSIWDCDFGSRGLHSSMNRGRSRRISR